jgi:hypothetical protein
MFWQMPILTSWGDNQAFEMYLTRNATLATQAGYDPTTDPSVGLVFAITRIQGGTAFNNLLYTQQNALETIASENTGCGTTGTGGAGSLFMCQLAIPNANFPCCGVGSQVMQASFYLNFTGASTQANNRCAGFGGGVSGYQGGSGCSVIISTKAATVTASTGYGSQGTPKFLFQGMTYYLGFWAQGNINGNFRIAFDNGNANGPLEIDPNAIGAITEHSMQVSVAQISSPSLCTAPNVPVNCIGVANPGTIDTGGFFGPVIRALIAIGVFIAQDIISFFSFLYTLTVPVFSAAATIIGTVFVTVLNAFGNIFGDSSLGTQVNSAFTQILAYLTNVFSSAIGLWANVVTMLKNMISFFSTFFTNFQTFIESFLLTIVNLWGPILGVWNEIMKWFNQGSMTIQQIIMIDYVIGMFKVYTAGTDGFKDWLDLNEVFTIKIFKGAYFMLNEAYSFVVQLKQLLFGNRISPVTIAGEG